jgi:hypothetical protein
MGISGSFNDFQWEADIDENELEDADGVEVEVVTPTGGKIAFSVYGPWEDIDVFKDLVEEDVESYTDLS